MSTTQFFVLMAIVYAAPHMSRKRAAIFSVASMLVATLFLLMDYLK